MSSPSPVLNNKNMDAISINVISMCSSDERDRVQKKTFTKWVNKHLIKVCAIALFESTSLSHPKVKNSEIWFLHFFKEKNINC